MESRLIDLFYGSILHDIGKVVQRSTGEKKRHSVIGKDFTAKYSSSDDLLNCISYHHYYEINNKRLPNDSLCYITYIADNISSGIDRRESVEESDLAWDTLTNLEDIFNVFMEFTNKRYYKPMMLNEYDNLFEASTDHQRFSRSEYSAILKKISDSIASIEFSQQYFDSTLHILESTLSYVPSSTNGKEVADISLFDHLKLTTALAYCIYHYAEEQNWTNYKLKFFTQSDVFYQLDAFRLVSFDISGIQDFLYTIIGSGAQKQLRSRSFYLEMLAEVISDRVIDECNLTKANCLYLGGGHSYFIVPNIPSTVHTIERIEQETNDWFLQMFQTKLFIAFGSCSFSAIMVMSGSDNKEYKSIFQNTSRDISEKKLNRYSLQTIIKLNNIGKRTGRECKICNSIDNINDIDGTDICELCFLLMNFSADIQNEKYFELNDSIGLPIGPQQYIRVVSEEDIIKNRTQGKIYTKNNYMTGANINKYIWVADHAFTKDTSNYASLSANLEGEGIKRLAVFRCDVDDLGLAFIAGYSVQKQGIYNTLSRTTAFSRSMSQFYKLLLNQIASEYKLTIVYSGGDDVFAVGAWKDIIDFSVVIYKRFREFSNNKLSISAGIGLFHEKTPVNMIANTTGELETVAKMIDEEKSGITLFSPQFTFKYQEFIDCIYEDKLKYIRSFFSGQDERGKTLIYKLLSLIQERDSVNKITMARVAYYLSMIEQSSTNEEFSKFKDKFRLWFDSEQHIKQLELSLMLYVYEIRKVG